MILTSCALFWTTNAANNLPNCLRYCSLKHGSLVLDGIHWLYSNGNVLWNYTIQIKNTRGYIVQLLETMAYYKVVTKVSLYNVIVTTELQRSNPLVVCAAVDYWVVEWRSRGERKGRGDGVEKEMVEAHGCSVKWMTLLNRVNKANAYVNTATGSCLCKYKPTHQNQTTTVLVYKSPT